MYFQDTNQENKMKWTSTGDRNSIKFRNTKEIGFDYSSDRKGGTWFRKTESRFPVQF